MPSEEQRYRLNVTVQPYEDLKTALGWIVVIVIAIVACFVYLVYLLWPLLVAVAVGIAGVLVFKGLAAMRTAPVLALPDVAAAGNSAQILSAASTGPAEELGMECKACSGRHMPVFRREHYAYECPVCSGREYRWRCLRCGEWTGTWGPHNPPYTAMYRCKKCRSFFCTKCPDYVSRLPSGNCPTCGAPYTTGDSATGLNWETITMSDYVSLRQSLAERAWHIKAG